MAYFPELSDDERDDMTCHGLILDSEYYAVSQADGFADDLEQIPTERDGQKRF